MVYGFSDDLNTRSGFLDVNLMPLIDQHMSQGGERILPLSGGYSSCYSIIRYPFQPLDQAEEDQWPRFNEHVGGSEFYSTPPKRTWNLLYNKANPSLGPPIFILYCPEGGFWFIGCLQLRKQFSRNEPDATHPLTCVSNKRQNTAYIGRVFSLLLFHLICLSTIGYNSSRSTTKVHCACCGTLA